jgi:hypothetical protein
VLPYENHSCCGVELVLGCTGEVAPWYNDQLHSPGNGTNSLLLRGLCEPRRCSGHNGDNERDPRAPVANLGERGRY